MYNEFEKPELPPKVRLGIVTEVVFLLFAGIVFLSIMNQESEPSRELKISNLSSAVAGLSEKNVSTINAALYQTISENNPNSTIKITGYNVRKNSVVEEYDSEKDIHTAEFIVDSESGKSYRISYKWSKNDFNENLSLDSNIEITEN